MNLKGSRSTLFAIKVNLRILMEQSDLGLH